METILAIETSTARGSIALYKDGRPLDVVEFSSDRSHNSVIFGPLESMLKLATPDLIVVGTGPGSYSGIRVGIAAGMGISLAHDIPLVGLPSLTAFGEAYGLERYAVVGDARRGSWWYAEVESGMLVSGPEVDDEAGIRTRVGNWPGQLYTLDGQSPPFCQAMPVKARADVLACRAASLSVEGLARLAAVETEPLYLRAPFITVSRKPSGLAAHTAPRQPS